MSSTASPTATSATSAASPTSSGCGAILYNIPVQDASCALPYGGNHTAIMSACCGSADVVAYADNCGLYCLAEGPQTVANLVACMEQHGAAYSDVFCRGEGNATASSATAGSATLASGASVVAGPGASKSSSSSTGTATGGNKSGSTSGSNAVAGGVPWRGPMGITLSGGMVSALLFSSVLLGALQL